MAADTVSAIAVGVLATVAIVFAALYAMRQIRLRRIRLHGREDRPEIADDRAFNRMAMARREADVLERQGRNVARARELLATAQREFGLRQFDAAFEHAHAAHEALVEERRRLPPAPAAAPASLSPAPSAEGVLERAFAPSSPPAEAPRTLPKNRAESQFQLRLLDADLVKAQERGPERTETKAAADLYQEAQAAFSREEYTEALRLALRGRRQVGSAVETVALGAAAPARAPQDGEADLTAAAEAVAGRERCARCGHPSLPGDTFCRGCGAPRSAPACPKCGAPRTPADGFCGRCGASFS